MRNPPVALISENILTNNHPAIPRTLLKELLKLLFFHVYFESFVSYYFYFYVFLIFITIWL